MLAGNTDFVQNNPIATKRVLRAILKAADLCVSEPQRVARQIVDDGFTANYDYALQTMNDVPTTRGGTTIRKTRSGFTRCASRDRHDQVEPAEDHRQTAPIGASSTS